MLKIGTKFKYQRYDGEVIENHETSPNKLDNGEIFVGLTDYADDESGECYSFTSIILEVLIKDHK